MEKYFIFIIMLSLSLLFGCSYHKNVEKESDYDKASDNPISIPILNDDSIALETSSLDRDAMFDITHMVGQNTMTGKAVNIQYKVQIQEHLLNKFVNALTQTSFTTYTKWERVVSTFFILLTIQYPIK